MKHLLIASAALLALTACGGSSTPAGGTITDIAKTIESETDLETLRKAEADATAKIEEAIKVKNKATAAIGSVFLNNNAKAEGVVTAASGLQYKVIQAGLENGAQAAPGQEIAAHYHGFFVSGDVFDSSYKRGRPLTGPSNGFIPGWNESLGEMKVCEARTLYINSDLAYGPDDGRGIPGGSTLLFHMQLLAVAGESENGDVHECPEDKILTGPEAY